MSIRQHLETPGVSESIPAALQRRHGVSRPGCTFKPPCRRIAVNRNGKWQNVRQAAHTAASGGGEMESSDMGWVAVRLVNGLAGSVLKAGRA